MFGVSDIKSYILLNGDSAGPVLQYERGTDGFASADGLEAPQPDLGSACPITKYKRTNYPVINSYSRYMYVLLRKLGSVILFFLHLRLVSDRRVVGEYVTRQEGGSGPQGLAR